ncbi:MAG TPA: hypothetical protein VKZ72_10445 [Acidimicrobiales bacterium]|nr:hypothetical protein [Acidimicrobiales bacterium]
MSRATRWAVRARRAFDDALWGPETAARLVFVHTALSALIGVRIVAGSYRQLAETPPALVDPVPILGFLDRMPSAEVFVALQVVGGLAALAAVLRRHPRLAFAVAWVCYLVLAGLRGSRGKVLHNDLLLLWASAPFLLAPVDVDRRDPVPRRRYGWPIRVGIVVTALIYFFAGYHKLRRSGPSWAYGDNMRYIALWGPAIGSSGWEGIARWTGEHIWVARASGVFILGLELAYPVVVFVPKTRLWFAAGAVFLHVSTWFLLGLDYWAWAVTVPLLLVDWPAALARFRERRAGRAGAEARPATAG